MATYSDGADVRGISRLIKNLGGADKLTKKASKAALKAGMGVYSRGIRKNVSGLPLADSEHTKANRKKKLLRTTVSHSVKKARGKNGQWGAKAGFGVGKQSKKMIARSVTGRSYGLSGVGIGKKNIHWFVLGTSNMEPVKGIESTVKNAARSGRREIVAAMQKRYRAVLQREYKKLRK